MYFLSDPCAVAPRCPPPTASNPAAETHGYTANEGAFINRLKRIEGQVRGVQGMVEDDRYCIDVLTQINAIQAALDKVALGLLDDDVQHCVMGAEAMTRPRRPKSSWRPWRD